MHTHRGPFCRTASLVHLHALGPDAFYCIKVECIATHCKDICMHCPWSHSHCIRAGRIVKHGKYIPFADALWSIPQMHSWCISTHHVQNTLQCITRMHWGHIMIALNSRCINVYYITSGLDFHALGLARGDLKYPPFLFALFFFTKTNSTGLGALSWPLFWSAKANRTTDLCAFQPADTCAIPIHTNASQMQSNSK